MPCIFSARKQKPTQEHIDVARDILKFFGGQGQFSRESGWHRNYIHGWVNGHYFLPFERAEYIQTLSDGKWTVLQIRPDLKSLKKYFEIS